MAVYNIYAGLGGGFGGVSYKGSEEFDNQEEADEYARIVGFEEYDSYGGLYGLQTIEDVEEGYREENQIEGELDNTHQENISDIFHEVVEGWVSYYAVLPENDEHWDKENNCSYL